MREETRVETIYCDRCHPLGNDSCSKRRPRRFFGQSITVPWARRTASGEKQTWKQLAIDMGWWIGKTWHYCPRCKGHLDLVSKAGQKRRVSDQQEKVAA